MPKIDLSRGLDVFAFIDADSDEAKGFTTYLGYWDGLARLIEDLYGADPARAIVAEMTSRRAVNKLQAKKFTGDNRELTSVLLNGWAQEVALYAVDDDDPRLMLQNTPGDSYEAGCRAASPAQSALIAVSACGNSNRWLEGAEKSWVLQRRIFRRRRLGRAGGEGALNDGSGGGHAAPVRRRGGTR